MKSKIDRLQYFCLILDLVYSKAIGFTSGIISREVGADNWISMLIGFIIGIIVFLVMTLLASRFPDKTIVQYSKDLLGNWVPGSISLILSVFFVLAHGLKYLLFLA